MKFLNQILTFLSTLTIITKGKCYAYEKFDSSCSFKRRKNVSHDPKLFDALIVYLQNSARTHDGFEIYSYENNMDLKVRNGFDVIVISSI